MTIISIAAAALLAITTYNRHRANVIAQNGSAPNSGAIENIRQSTSVVLAIADAVWAVLDALMFFTRSRGGSTGAPLRQGGMHSRPLVDLA